ncbi:Uncharacterised protein [Enterobacter cloacae]|nr:Uncharacterised protein [Enterobacter cloacae]
MQLGDLAVVALEEGDQVARQVVLVLVGQAADDAAVHRDVLRAPGRAGADEDVAGVHVGMEEAVAEHLGEEDLHAALGQCLEVGALVAQGFQVGHRDAVDALHHQHLGPAPVPVDLWHVEQRRAFEVAPQLRGVGCLAEQVEFVDDGFLVVADHFHGVQAPRLAGDPLGEAGEDEQPGDVGADHRFQVRPDHLHHHFLAALQPRGVDLGHRGRGQRFAFEAGEDLFDLRAQLFLDALDRQLRREGRHLVLQPGQFVGDVVGQQVAAGGENLAELDEDRSEVLQRQAQARAAGQFQLAPRQPAPGQGGTEQAQPPGQHRQFEDQVVQAVADDDALDAQEAAESEELHASGLVFWLRRPTRASRRSRASFSWSSSAKRASASCWPTSVRLSSAR